MEKVNWLLQELRITFFANSEDTLELDQLAIYENVFSIEPEQTIKHSKPIKAIVEKGSLKDFNAAILSRVNRIDINLEPVFQEKMFLEKQNNGELYVPSLGGVDILSNLFTSLSLEKLVNKVKPERFALFAKFVSVMDDSEKMYDLISSLTGLNFDKDSSREIMMTVNYTKKRSGVEFNHISKIYQQNLQVKTSTLNRRTGHIEPGGESMNAEIVALEFDFNSDPQFNTSSWTNKDIIDNVVILKDIMRARVYKPFERLSV